MLPNGRKIDTDGIIDAMEDVTGKTRYFLDTVSGEVGCVSAADKDDVVRFSNDRRYAAIPPASSAIQSRWLKEFMEMILETETLAERSLHKKLTAVLKIEHSEAFDQCLKMMGKADESLLAGWASWQGDHLFEEMKAWFATLPVAIGSDFEADCDCELCKLIMKGPHTAGDFNEALQKKERKIISQDAMDALPTGAFLPYSKLFPEETEVRMRKIDLLQDTFGLSRGSYLLVENYCADKACDCRKAMINVVKIGDRPVILGTVGFGWESERYYADWIGDKATARMMVGAYLEPGGIQTDKSASCLKLVNNSLRDDKYVELIKERYKVFKEKLALLK